MCASCRLEGTRYDDKVTGSRGLVESGQALTFSGETDRVYGSAAKVIVTDPGLRRRIVVEKRGSLSTVVWNPWSDRAKHMVDFGDDEWPRMLCVEAANTRPQQVRLAAGKRHVTETCIFAQST